MDSTHEGGNGNLVTCDCLLPFVHPLLSQVFRWQFERRGDVAEQLVDLFGAVEAVRRAAISSEYFKIPSLALAFMHSGSISIPGQSVYMSKHVETKQQGIGAPLISQSLSCLFPCLSDILHQRNKNTLIQTTNGSLMIIPLRSRFHHMPQ